MPKALRRPLRPLAFLCAAPLLLGACTVVRETLPAHTATEQLLLSHATELAAETLAGALPAGRRAFVDSQYVSGDVGMYAVSAVRAAALKRGLMLASDRASSDIVIEVRMGAASIDSSDSVLGIPAVNVAVPGTLTAVPLPELSFYSRAHRRGATELAAFAYETASGRPVAFIGPLGGIRELNRTRILTVFGSGTKEEQPGLAQPGG